MRKSTKPHRRKIYSTGEMSFTTALLIFLIMLLLNCCMIFQDHIVKMFDSSWEAITDTFDDTCDN